MVAELISLVVDSHSQGSVAAVPKWGGKNW